MKKQSIEQLLSELTINITNNVNAKKAGMYERSVERRREIETIKEEIKRRCADDK